LLYLFHELAARQVNDSEGNSPQGDCQAAYTSRRYTLRVTINSKPCGLPMSFAGAKSIEFINQLIGL